MNEIFVTNKNTFDHRDSYDGEEYEFPAGQKVLIPVPAAIHMFGFNRRDKSDNLIRLGWANLPDDEGAKRLAKFVFTMPVLVEQPIDDATALPSPTEDEESQAEAA